MGDYQPVKPIACVNHDPLAIESHKANHDNLLHLNEDIRSQAVIDQIARLTRFYRKKYPDAIVVLWASMECTNYSKAKGGEPKDADSRSLPKEMPRYIDAINPDYFKYENVDEFRAWGPLDENGRPKSMKKGRDYLRWVQDIKNMGYRYEWRVLNSANYGAHTSRKRLFGIFAKGDLPICWPESTHAEQPKENGMFPKLKPWRPVRECLDFADEGKSIFKRERPLVENTLKRIYAGLQKYVGDDDSFIMKYYGNGDNVDSIEDPAGTITTKDRLSLVKAAFIDKQYRSKYNHQSVNQPAGSILSNDKHCLVTAWLDKAYTGKHNHQGIDEPAGVILTKDKYAVVQAHFIDRQFGSGDHNHQSILKPLGTIMAYPKSNLVSVKAAPGKEVKHLKPKDSDTPTMKKIKTYCRKHGIIDIRTRMLRVQELKRIQGLGDDYYLAGNKTDQKKFIGNSVPPDVVKAMMEALAHGLLKSESVAA